MSDTDHRGRGDNRAEEIKALARDYAELAIETLAQVMNDDEAPPPARVKAADVMLQRGFGAPERKVEQNVNVAIVDERQAHLTALRRLGERTALPAPVAPIVDAEFEDVTPTRRK